MADATSGASTTAGTGYCPPGGNYCGPGYGMATLVERLQRCVGKVVTVYVGEEAVPVRGMLHAVGPNYLEVHRMTETVKEAVIIPLPAVISVVISMQA